MDFKVYIEDEKKLKKCKRFVTGFHGLGEIGFITMRHLIDELPGCNRIATIVSSGSPPFISIEDGKLRLPFEVYGYQDIAIFLPRLQPYRHVQSEFSDELSQWVIKNFDVGYFVGGVDIRLRTKENIARFIPTRGYLTNATEKERKKLEENVLEQGLFVTGPLAIMLGLLDLNGFPALGILTYAERERPDPQGAANAISILNEKLELKVSVEDLTTKAREIEEEVRQRMQLASQVSNNEPPTYT